MERSPRNKIVACLFRSSCSLSVATIAARTGLDKQLITYHLVGGRGGGGLVAEGVCVKLAFKSRTHFSLQPFFYNREMMKLLEGLLGKAERYASDNVILENARVDKPTALRNSFVELLKLVETKSF